jgi:hypothetical protein
MILVAHQVRVRRALLSTALAGATGPARPAGPPANVPDPAPAGSDGLAAGLRAGPVASILQYASSERTVPAMSCVGPRVLNPLGSA